MAKEKLIGVYIWKNKFNGKVYIGCSTDIHKRWGQHIKTAKRGSTYPFHEAIREFGEEYFEKDVIEKIEDPSLLGVRENYWIKKYNSIEEGYNVLSGYNSITFNPNIEDIKQRIKQKASIRKWIYKNNIQKSVYKEEIKKYIGDGWILGRPKFSEEHKKELSESHEGIGLSDSAKDKLSALWLNRNHSEKTKKMMSEKLMGRYSRRWYHEKYGIEEGEEKYQLHAYHNSLVRRGKIWIHRDKLSKQIHKEEYEKYRNDGWSTGRK
jgi:group I intron endonuclease